MINMSKDISSKLEPAQVEVLIDIVQMTSELGFPFFVVGATARDIVFSAIFGIPPIQATLDIDLAIRVARWEDYQELRKRMLSNDRYKPDASRKQRLIHRNGTLVDLIPFGSLEDPAGIISWPPENDIVIRTVGFEEALRSSLDVIISHDPDVEVQVCTPPALAVMKIISWSDKYPERTRDAQDLMFLMKHYIELGNQTRIWDGDSDILNEGNFDYEQASARLLGRDIRKIMKDDTRNLVNAILERETNPDSQLRLVTDMARARLEGAEEILSLLTAMKKGITETKGIEKHDAEH